MLEVGRAGNKRAGLSPTAAGVMVVAFLLPEQALRTVRIAINENRPDRRFIVGSNIYRNFAGATISAGKHGIVIVI